MKQYLFFIGLCLALFSFSSCEDDNPEPTQDPELITTLTLTMTPQGGGDAIVFRFQDLDGDGGNAPTITNGVLAANTIYDVTIELLNESVSPAEDITAEVGEEAEEHQFFFDITGGLNVTYGYRDSDANNNPIGLAIVLNTGEVSSGKFQVTLRHEPSKNASGVSDGDITNAGGDTDIEVTFDIDIQ